MVKQSRQRTLRASHVQRRRNCGQDPEPRFSGSPLQEGIICEEEMTAHISIIAWKESTDRRSWGLKPMGSQSRACPSRQRQEPPGSREAGLGCAGEVGAQEDGRLGEDAAPAHLTLQGTPGQPTSHHGCRG